MIFTLTFGVFQLGFSGGLCFVRFFLRYLLPSFNWLSWNVQRLWLRKLLKLDVLHSGTCKNHLWVPTVFPGKGKLLPVEFTEQTSGF